MLRSSSYWNSWEAMQDPCQHVWAGALLPPGCMALQVACQRLALLAGRLGKALVAFIVWQQQRGRGVACG